MIVNLLERSGPRPSSATRQRHSPRARRRARESGVDLDRVESAPSVVGVTPTSTAPSSCVVEVDVTALAADGTSALLAAVVVAVVRALRTHPRLAAAVDGGLGVVVDTSAGPALVHLPDANDLNRTALARRIEPGPGQGQTSRGSDVPAGFTVVDVGSRGVLFAAPALGPGQPAALGIGAVVERPVVARTADGEPAIAIRSMAHLVLTVDPAQVDDRTAATFLRAVQDGLTARDDRE